MSVLLLINEQNLGRDGEIPQRFITLSNAIRQCGFSPRFGMIDSADSLERIIADEKQGLDFAFSTFFQTPAPHRRVVNIHEILEQYSIPYIGSSPSVLEMVLSKALMKHQWEEAGVRTPGFKVIQSLLQIDALVKTLEDDEYPFMVKPSREGNSRGITDRSVVFDPHSLAEACMDVMEQHGETLVEEYLGNRKDMREFTVAMIGNGEGALFLPVELVLRDQQKLRVISTKDKENGGVALKKITDPILRVELIEFARQACKSAKVRDYARCDIILADEKLYALEINGQPMMPDPWFSACAMDADLSEYQYLAAVLYAGIIRINKTRIPHLPIPADLLDLLPEETRIELDKS